MIKPNENQEPLGQFGNKSHTWPKAHFHFIGELVAIAGRHDLSSTYTKVIAAKKPIAENSSATLRSRNHDE